MKQIYHLPNQIAFPDTLPSELRARLQTVIEASIRQLAEHSAGGARVVIDPPKSTALVREHYASPRILGDQSSYAIPSYDAGGAPTEIPLKHAGAADAAPAALHWRHAHSNVADDRVINGASPFEEQLVAIFPGWQAVRVHGDRYAVSGDLRRAVGWGNMLFGARSYAIFEGPTGQTSMRYYVLGTNQALHARDAAPGSGSAVAGGEVWGMKQRIHWQTQLHDDQHGAYMLRALFTAEGQPMWPLSRELVEEFYNELRLGNPQQQFIPKQLARPLVFGEIDRLIGAGKTEDAAHKLAELDAVAFGLLDWPTKAQYLELLTDAWTLEAQEIAIIEMLKSISGRSELDAALAVLKQKGKHEQLFRDMNSQLWSLLVEVGKRFGDPAPFSYRTLIELLQDAGLVPRDWKDIAKYITLAPAGPLISNDLFAEAEEAARSFIEFLGGAIEGVVMLVAHPDKLIEGVAQLVKLSVMVQLAEMGHPPAVQFVSAIVKNLAQQVVDGLKGALVLGISGSLLRRVKWAIIWEVASWFIGIGEVKAAISGIGITEKLSALGRLLRILRLIGQAGEVERTAAKMEQLARLLQKVSIIAHEDQVLRLFAHLPEGDILRIARHMESADVHAAQSIAELAAKHPELAEAAQHALGRAEALYRLESRAGRLSDNLVEGFQKLATRSGFSNAELFSLMESLSPEHAELYMRLIRAMPESAFGERIGARGYAFFNNLAQRPQAMRFMAESGYATFSALYRHANYDFARFEEQLLALQDLAQKLPVDQRAVEFQRLLDRLAAGDTAAAEQLRAAINARRAAAGRPLMRSYSAAELEQIARTTPDIRTIRQLAAQMDNSSAGSLFERWVHQHVFDRQAGTARVRLNVRSADNPHLEQLWHDRVSDVYYGADGSVWDAKIYRSGGEIDVMQLDDYRKMEEAGFVINADGQRRTVNSINYVFSDRAAAEANRATLHVQGGAEAWFIDDHGVLQHLN